MSVPICDGELKRHQVQINAETNKTKLKILIIVQVPIMTLEIWSARGRSNCIQVNFTMLVSGNQAMKKKLVGNLQANYVEKIRDFKVWSDLHTPALLKPALSYALDWLSPELLGTGFVITEASDESVSAKVPYQRTNCDFHNQIHAGLVVNAALEVISTFISKHWAKNLWEIKSYQLEVSKNLKWDKDLVLQFSCSEQDMDKFILSLQKNDQVAFEGTVFIATKNSSQSDSVKLKLNIIKLKLLA
jgi:hypothetical protein